MTMSDPQTFNIYAYARNDPVNHTNSLGLQFVTGCIEVNGQSQGCRTEYFLEWVPYAPKSTVAWQGSREGGEGGSKVRDHGDVGEERGAAFLGKLSTILKQAIPKSCEIGFVVDAQALIGFELSAQFVFDLTGNKGLLITPAVRAGPDVNLSAGVSGFLSWAPDITKLQGGSLGSAFDLVSASVSLSAALDPDRASGDLRVVNAYPQLGLSGGLGAGIGFTGEAGYGFLCRP